MMTAMACFIVNDALAKHVSESLPAGQLIVVRGIFACLLVLLVAKAMGIRLQFRQLQHPWVFLRAAIEAVAALLYLWALFHIPLANATAINLSTPMVITVLAMIFFREQVDGARWLAILAGFTGVLLVIQPRGADFNAYALFSLMSMVLYACRDLLTRKIPAEIPSMLITFSTAISVGLLAVVFMAVQGTAPISTKQLGLLALAAAFLAGGYYFIVQASRQGEFSVVAPFRYTGLLGSLILGYLIWGHVPNLMAWTGIVLLLAAGLFMLRRER